MTLNAKFVDVVSFAGKTIYNPHHPEALSLKGQMHCHSTESDGNQSPAVVVTAYRDAGYDFVALTDHDIVGTDPGVSGIIFLVGGNEISMPRHHTVYAGSALQDLAHLNFTKTMAIGSGFLVPTRWQYGAMEIFNPYDNFPGAPAYGLNDADIDAFLTHGSHLWLTAVDDCHDLAGYFNLGWIVVNCAERTAMSIWESIDAGNFYASSGNDITVSLSESGLITAASGVSSTFTFIGKAGTTLKNEAEVTSSSYQIVGTEKYVRIKSVNAAGKYAWGQPIWIN
jgi:hypothetical protein